jgi:CRISPR-associated protein Cmr6
MSTFDLKINAARQASAWQLALDKFPFNTDRDELPLLTELGGNEREQSIKPRRLKEIRNQYAAAQPALKATAERQQHFVATLAHQHGKRFRRVTLINSSRLLLHLGRSSVLENVGLYCDRTTGLPIIPGTAVKGAVSTWACWAGNQDRDTFLADRSTFTSDALRILGANPGHDKTSKIFAGIITFIGAFPQTAPGMDLDIVTPHPDDGRGRITPSPFLAIKADTKWDFALLASVRVSEQEATILLDQATTWLIDCLTQLGLGAKTAAGYGNFRCLTSLEAEADQARFQPLITALKEERVRAGMTDEDRAYHDFVKSVTDWAPLARDIASKPEPDKSLILRFFRSDEGKCLIKNWPNNDKSKVRKKALSDAGL